MESKLLIANSNNNWTSFSPISKYLQKKNEDNCGLIKDIFVWNEHKHGIRFIAARAKNCNLDKILFSSNVKAALRTWQYSACIEHTAHEHRNVG